MSTIPNRSRQHRAAPVRARAPRLAAPLLTAALLACAGIAQATWVRGTAFVGASSIDPLFQAYPPDVLTQSVATGQFSDAHKSTFSQADLGNGALRGRVSVLSGGFLVDANPRIGETLTFVNGTGQPQPWDFDLAIDGTVTTTGDPVPITETIGGQTVNLNFVTLALHVFPGNSVSPAKSPNNPPPVPGRKDWLQAFLDGDALFSEVRRLDFGTGSNFLDNVDLVLSDDIAGQLMLPPGESSFDVVMLMGLAAQVPGTNVSTITMDFSKTAAFSITTPPGVSVTSQSGLFLTGRNVTVPEPGGLALLGLGLTLLGRLRAPHRPRMRRGA